jgi:hypothetical protein
MYMCLHLKYVTSAPFCTCTCTRYPRTLPCPSLCCRCHLLLPSKHHVRPHRQAFVPRRHKLTRVLRRQWMFFVPKEQGRTRVWCHRSHGLTGVPVEKHRVPAPLFRCLQINNTRHPTTHRIGLTITTVVMFRATQLLALFLIIKNQPK